jgi:hypothetical protein
LISVCQRFHDGASNTAEPGKWLHATARLNLRGRAAA